MGLVEDQYPGIIDNHICDEQEILAGYREMNAKPKHIYEQEQLIDALAFCLDNWDRLENPQLLDIVRQEKETLQRVMERVATENAAFKVERGEKAQLIDNLKRKITELQAKVEELEDIEGSYEDLKSDYDNEIHTHGMTQDELERLQNRVDELEEELSELKSQYNDLMTHPE